MLRSLRVPFRRLTLLNYQKPKRGPRSLFVSWSSFRNFFYCPSIVDLLWTSGTKRIAGKPVGNLKKILMFQREMSEEGGGSHSGQGDGKGKAGPRLLPRPGD